MIKLMMLMKKRPDLSREQFIDYYDNHHVPLMHSLLSLGAAVHRRNFVLADQAPQAGAEGAGAPGSAEHWDAIVEICYEDAEVVRTTMKELEDPEIRRRMQADEDNFILRGSIRRFAVEVHETIFRPL